MYSLAPIRTRNDFPKLMKERGLSEGVAVEVGVHRGEYAKVLLEQWPKTIRYVGVDPWACPPGYESQVEYLWGGGDRNADKEATKEVIGTKGGVLQADSVTASKTFDDSSLIFIYLDGDHRYEAVKADLEAWWPKLKRGGILAGHDWMFPGKFGEPDDWGPGIQRAVSEFAGPRGLTTWLVVEADALPWSFYLIKE